VVAGVKPWSSTCRCGIILFFPLLSKWNISSCRYTFRCQRSVGLLCVFCSKASQIETFGDNACLQTYVTVVYPLRMSRETRLCLNSTLNSCMRDPNHVSTRCTEEG